MQDAGRARARQECGQFCNGLLPGVLLDVVHVLPHVVHVLRHEPVELHSGGHCAADIEAWQLRRQQDPTVRQRPIVRPLLWMLNAQTLRRRSGSLAAAA